MLEKYFTSGEKIELHSINKALVDQDGDKGKIYFSKINQILDDEKIEIMIPMEQAKLVILPRGIIFDMVAITQNGLYECKVKIGNRYKNDNVYLQVLEVVSPVKRYQRREFYRYSCSVPVYCRHMTPEEQESFIWDSKIKGEVCTTIELGGGGVRFITDVMFDENVPVICAVELIIKGKIKEICAMGKILSMKPIKDRREFREVRVQFEEISNTAREEIVQYIFEDERRRRSRNNGL